MGDCDLGRVDKVRRRTEQIGSLGGVVAAEARPKIETGLANRLRALAQRCREAAQWTTVPDLARELDDIAGRLSREAEGVESK